MPRVVDGDGSKMPSYISDAGLCVVLVMSLADRVRLRNQSSGRPALAQELSAGLVGKACRARGRACILDCVEEIKVRLGGRAVNLRSVVND